MIPYITRARTKNQQGYVVHAACCAPAAISMSHAPMGMTHLIKYRTRREVFDKHPVDEAESVGSGFAFNFSWQNSKLHTILCGPCNGTLLHLSSACPKVPLSPPPPTREMVGIDQGGVKFILNPNPGDRRIGHTAHLGAGNIQ